MVAGRGEETPKKTLCSMGIKMSICLCRLLLRSRENCQWSPIRCERANRFPFKFCGHSRALGVMQSLSVGVMVVTFDKWVYVIVSFQTCSLYLRRELKKHNFWKR